MSIDIKAITNQLLNAVKELEEERNEAWRDADAWKDIAKDERNLKLQAMKLAEKYHMYAVSGTFPSWEDEGIPWQDKEDE